MTEDELVKRYSKKVLILARQFFLFGGDSDDLIQEGMLGLISAIRSFDREKEANFSTYAENCIRHKLIDAIRSKGYVEFISSEDYPADGVCISPEEQFIENEKYQELLVQFRKKLSKFEYAVLEKYLEGFSYTDIADYMNKPVSSIYNAVQRIRQKLLPLNHLSDISAS